jgi:hypothetical protein
MGNMWGICWTSGGECRRWTTMGGRLTGTEKYPGLAHEPHCPSSPVLPLVPEGVGTSIVFSRGIANSILVFININIHKGTFFWRLGLGWRQGGGLGRKIGDRMSDSALSSGHSVCVRSPNPSNGPFPSSPPTIISPALSRLLEASKSSQKCRWRLNKDSPRQRQSGRSIESSPNPRPVPCAHNRPPTFSVTTRDQSPRSLSLLRTFTKQELLRHLEASHFAGLVIHHADSTLN